MKKMTLEEAYRNGIVKIGDYFDYKPTFGRCELSPEQTGWMEPQFFETEELGWRLDEIDGKFILVATMPTRTKLWLRGKVGYVRGIKSQNSIAKACYANWQIAKDVMSLNTELCRKLHECNILYDIMYWLSSSYDDFTVFGMYFVLCGSVSKFSLCDSDGNIDGSDFGVRPVVFLKSDLQLVELKDCNGSQKKPWTFSIGTLSQNSQDERLSCGQTAKETETDDSNPNLEHEQKYPFEDKDIENILQKIDNVEKTLQEIREWIRRTQKKLRDDGK